MADNDRPAANPEAQPSTGEFDFAAPITQGPRLKRRSLKTRKADSPSDIVREAPPLEQEPPPYQPDPRDDDDAEANAQVQIKDTPASKTKTGSQPHFASTARPTVPTSPHGTRPATLYYSSGNRKEKQKEKPVSSPPTPSTPAPTMSTTPAPTSPTTRPAAATRPATVVDYRTNIDRQAREQKSVGGVLAILVYCLIAFVVIGAGLAGYGAYAVGKQLQKQSLTITDLDKHYASETLSLAAQIKSTQDALTQAQTQTQAQLAREQELIVQQQESINKLIAADTATVTALKQERAARADETSALKSRVRILENKLQERRATPVNGPTTQRY